MKANIELLRRFTSIPAIKKLFSMITVLSLFILPFTANWNQQAAGTITGRVFQDYNGNGIYNTTTTISNDGLGTIGVAVDRGIAGVTVSAYDSTGVLRGTATTLANGTYSLSATGTGPYRIEFTNLPAGYFPSARSTDSVLGGSATNSGSTVQIVNDGNTSNVNLAINHPEDYSQNNPEVLAAMYKAGDQGTGATGFPVLVSFPYSAGSNDTGTGANTSLYDAPTANPLSISAIDLGTTYGLVYARNSRLIYSAAFFKRHAGFGPGGPNQIYVINRTGSGNIQTSFTVPGTATNQHDTSNYPRDNGNIGWDAVGKSSLGGMAISDDETALFVYNLANRTLYKLNASNGSQIAAGSTLPTLPVNAGNCADTDRRPFALTMYRGVLYAGFVCTAQSSTTVDTFTDSNSNGQYDGGDYHIETNGTPGRQTGESYLDLNGNGAYNAGEAFVDNDGNGVYNIGDARNLRAYVFTVNQTTLAYSASPVFSLPLNYRRGVNQRSSGGFAAWRPWSAIYRNVNSNTLRPIYPQPMLTDLAFDNGNLILGLRDRISDQVGNGSLSNPSDPNNLNFYQPRPGGDVIRACGSVGSWTVESNGRCGGTGTAPQNSGEGIGGGEFYFGDSYTLSASLASPAVTINGKGSNHDETFSGGAEQLPGAPDVMLINFDPIPNVANETHDGGIRWLSNTNGSFTKGYRLYNGESGTGDDFGKSGGTGGNLTLMPDPAPIEIGNRVWNDTNSNGVQDAGENPISGVTVQLWEDLNGDGTVDVQVGSAVTDANGEYYFVSSTAVDPNTNDNIGQINGGIKYSTNYQVRIPTFNFNVGQPLESRILSPANNDGSANGDSRDSDGTMSGGNAVINFTTGGAGANNHTFDFGFYLSPTSSNVPVSGRISTQYGNGIRNVVVTLTTLDGRTQTTKTGTFGYYRFDEVEVGQTVTVTVHSKRFTFSKPTRVFSVKEAVDGLDFISDE